METPIETSIAGAPDARALPPRATRPVFAVDTGTVLPAAAARVALVSSAVDTRDGHGKGVDAFVGQRLALADECADTSERAAELGR